VLFETDSSGRGNWQFGESEGEGEATEDSAAVAEDAEKEKAAAVDKKGDEKAGWLPIKPLIRKLHLNGVRFAYVDAQKGDRLEVDSDTLHIDAREKKLVVDISGQYNQVPLALNGGLENDRFFVENTPTGIKLDGYFGEAKLSVEGQAGPHSPTFDVDVTATVATKSLAAVAPLAGRALPDVGPLTVSARLMGKEGQYSVSDLAAALDDPLLSAKADGAIADLNTLAGIDLTLASDTSRLSEVLGMFGVKPTFSIPDTLNAKVEAQGNLKELAINRFEANAHGLGLDAALQAKAKNIIVLEGVEAHISLDAASLDAIAEVAQTKLPPFAPLKATATIAAKDKHLKHMDLALSLRGQSIKSDIAGSIGDPLKVKEVNADLSLVVDNLEWLKDHVPVALPPLGALTASVKIVSNGDSFAANAIKAELSGGNLQATVAGAVDDLLKFKGVDADVGAGMDSLDTLSALAKTKLPAMGPLRLSANIASKGEALAARQVRLELDDPKVKAKVSGVVGDLMTAQGINADIEVDVQSLDDLSEVARTELPPFGPLKLSATVASEDETLGAKDIKLTLDDKQLQAKVAGDVDDLIKLKGIRADIDVGVQSLDVLSEVARTELPALGPLKVAANIASKGDTFEAKKIKVDLADDEIKARVTASIRDIMAVVGINADIDFSVDSLASLNEVTKQQLPASGPVSLKGKLSSAGLKAPLNVDTVVASDGVKARLNGSIADLKAVDGIAMTLTAEADSLQKVGRLAGKPLQGQEPIKLKGDFSANQRTYQVAGLHLEMGELDVKGNAAFKQTHNGGRPRLDADIQVGVLDLYQGKPKADQTDQENENGAADKAEDDPRPHAKAAAESEKLLPADPLPFDMLRGMDVDVDLAMAQLKTRLIVAEDLAASVTLDNGVLRLSSLQAKIGEGAMSGEASLDARNSPAVLWADLNVSDGTFRYFGGRFNIETDLDGRGDSVATIMASLDGYFEVDIRDVTLQKSFMTNFGTGLLSKINPFDHEEEETELLCMIALFEINDGVADARRKIAAQMTDVTWFGGGMIDFNTERIAFSFKPKSRKLLDVGEGGIAGLIDIGGTLADPGLRLDVLDAAVKYGKYTAHMATGGLTFLADLAWNKIRANQDVCAAILGHLEELEEEAAEGDDEE
jgi:uncharacterized protein involved in outer membrane biogenesis